MGRPSLVSSFRAKSRNLPCRAINDWEVERLRDWETRDIRHQTSDFLYDLLSAYSTYARPTPSRCARLPLPGEGASGGVLLVSSFRAKSRNLPCRAINDWEIERLRDWETRDIRHQIYSHDMLSAVQHTRGQPRLAALACPFQRKGLVGASFSYRHFERSREIFLAER